MQILGVTLIAAAIVSPAITARLLTDSFNRRILLSTLLGMLTGFLGMYPSYYIDIASGATIVLLQAALFCVALAISSAQRRVSRRLVRQHV